MLILLLMKPALIWICSLCCIIYAWSLYPSLSFKNAAYVFWCFVLFILYQLYTFSRVSRRPPHIQEECQRVGVFGGDWKRNKAGLKLNSLLQQSSFFSSWEQYLSLSLWPSHQFSINLFPAAMEFYFLPEVLWYSLYGCHPAHQPY